MTEQQAAKNRRVETDIMGISLQAETPQDFNDAALDWACNTEWEPMGLYTGIQYWEHRHGTKWQQDLEQHLATWRKPPRDFCNSIDLCVDVMQPRLEELGLMKSYRGAIEKESFAQPKDTYLWDYLLNLSAEARVDAALAAWDASQEKAT